MNHLPFLKVQSIGNHFVLVQSDAIQQLEGDLRASLSVDPAQLLNELAKLLCHDRFGIGADGLLVLEKGHGDVILRMFNADGSEDFCGNGLRCAAMVAHRHGWVGTSFRIQHGGKSVHAVIHADQSVEIELPCAHFEPDRVPLAEGSAEIWRSKFVLPTGEEALVSSLSTGSTHTILEVQGRPDDEIFFPVSQSFENRMETYPERTSVMWCYPDGPNRVAMRIWERGVGETLGCGTGSAAAAVVWMRGLKHGGIVTIANPGGDLVITAENWDQDLLIRGVPEEVYRGTFDFAVAAR